MQQTAGTLEVSGLRVSYGRSVVALRDVALRVEPGEMVALLGSNGAGKSTLLRALSGTLRLHRGAVDAGTITYAGASLAGRDPAASFAAGIVQVPEGRGIFGRLTVEENLRCGLLRVPRTQRRGPALDAARERVFTLFPVLAERRRQPAFLAGAAKLTKGDKVGMIYMQGDAGEPALVGAKYEAKKLGLSIVGQEVKPTDQDMTSQVSALKSAGVKAVLLVGTPVQTASSVGVAAATGMRVPMLSFGPGFAVQLMATPVAPALEKMLFVVSPLQVVGDQTNPVMKKLAADYKAEYPSSPIDAGATAGYMYMGYIAEDLKKACAMGDLSRAGILAAHRSLTSSNLGFNGPQDFSDPSEPSSRFSNISVPDKTIVGGLKPLKSNFKAPSVDSYEWSDQSH